MKKTKFDKNVQNITFKQDTCLNSGEFPAMITQLNTGTLKFTVTPMVFPVFPLKEKSGMKKW